MSCDKQTFTIDYEQIRQRLKAQKKWQAGRNSEHDYWLYLAINLLCLRLLFYKRLENMRKRFFPFSVQLPPWVITNKYDR